MSRDVVRWVALALSLGGVAVCGCAHRADPPAAQAVPLGMQLARAESHLKGKPLRTLLDFEAPSDLVFVSAQGGRLSADQKLFHTGRSSLVIGRGVRVVRVKVSSLVSGEQFPGHWTLLGAYFYAEEPVKVQARYFPSSGGVRTEPMVELPAKRWTPVLMDITPMPQAPTTPQAGTLEFTFDHPLASPVGCDNAILIDNSQTLVDSESGGPIDRWSVRQEGFSVIMDHPQQFRVILKTPQAVASGWSLEEANALRARFRSQGKEKARTIYADGREYLDGQFHWLGPSGDLADLFRQQHEAPAEIRVPEECGRVDRNTPGDANNDGYCEAVGAYQVAASNSRVSITLIPRGSGLLRPVIEIAGLPEGQMLVTMEGRLVDTVVRAEQGHVLVELPGKVDRATTVEVTVK